MTLAYTRDAGTGEKCRSGICTMSAGKTPKKLSTSEVCFLCKAKVSSDEKIKVFGKSTLKIHSLILRSTEVDLSVYIGSDLAAICRSKCYNRLLRYKRALDRVAEIENEIKQDFLNDGPFRVKRLAKDPGQTPEAKKSLHFDDANVNNQSQKYIMSTPKAGTSASSLASPSLPPVFTFGAVSPIAPVITFPTRGFLAPNGLVQNAFGGVTSGFTGRVLTSTPQKQVEFRKPERPIAETKETKVHLTVAYPSKPFHKELKDDLAVLGKAICNGSPQRIARAVLKNVALRKIIVEKVLLLMNTQLNDICSRKRPSILRANMKEEIVNFDFEKVCLEWKERAPIFYAFLMTCAAIKKEKAPEWLPSVAVSGSILLKQRNSHMNGCATVLGILIKSRSLEVRSHISILSTLSLT